jgi:outer membrane protein TolC
MQLRLIGILTLLSLVLNAPLTGAEAMTLEKAFEIALNNNLELQKAESAYEKALLQQHFSGRLNAPELGVSVRDDFAGEDEGEGGFEISLRQSFPVTSRLRTEKTISRIDLQAAQQEILEAKRQTAYQLEQLVVSLAISRQRLNVQRQLLSLNQEMDGFLKIQVERGEAPRIHLVQSQINSRRLGIEVRELEHKAFNLTEHLSQLLGTDEAVDVDYSLDLPARLPRLSEELELILQRRPDYQLALQSKDRRDVMLEHAQQSKWQDLTLSVFMEQESSTDVPNGLSDNTLAGVSLSWPLPFSSSSKLKESVGELDQDLAGFSAASLKKTIASELRIARHNLKEDYRLATDDSRKMVELAESNFKALREAYQLGQVGFPAVQDGQAQLLEAHESQLKAIAAYHEAWIAYRWIAAAYDFLTPMKDIDHEE